MFKNRVAGQAEEIANVVVVAPTHEAPSTKAAVATQSDAYVGPDLSQALHQQLDDGPGVSSAIAIGRPQVGDEESCATKDVQGQEAVVVVIAVEEAFFLMAMNDVVGGVQVEGELFGRRWKRSDELLDENVCDPYEGGSPDAVLEPAQGRRRSELRSFVRAGLLGMIGGELPKRIVAKVLVIVEIFVAGGKGEDALREQSALGMDDELGRAWIGDGSIESVEQSELSIGFAKEQDARIGGDVAAGEVRAHDPAIETGKSECRWITL